MLSQKVQGQHTSLCVGMLQLDNYWMNIDAN